MSLQNIKKRNLQLIKTKKEYGHKLTAAEQKILNNSLKIKK